MNTPFEPLLVSHLFPEMRAELIDVLRSLTDEQWSAPTDCEGWSVKDVAIHLLGDGIGMLSSLRDQEGQYRHFDTWQELVDFINAQNDLWVRANRRMSARILLQQLEIYGHEIAELLASLDPYEMVGSVGWTGNDSDPRWLHIAREYTEYWMHHQHICEAVKRDSLKSTRYTDPLIHTFANAFPQTYREVEAKAEATVNITIGNQTFYVIRDADRWRLYAKTDNPPDSTVKMSVDMAWRMFTKGIDKAHLLEQSTISGDHNLGEIALNTVAIIA